MRPLLPRRHSLSSSNFYLRGIFVSLPLIALLSLLTLCGCGKNAPASGDSSAVPPASAAQFVDVAESAGLNYTWEIPGKRPLNILQTIGNGCAFLDYDNDGNLDILLVGSKLALYKGDGKGHFTDVTHETGLDKLSGHFLGCAVGDYDGDGFDDLYICGYQTGLLLHNEGGKTFQDVTVAAGLKPQPWGTSCTFLETKPGSGKLDLYVGNYAAFGPDTEPQLCPEQGILTSCGPRWYKGLDGVFYRNEGSGKFTDATAQVGLKGVHGRALGVTCLIEGEDGIPTLAIANDEHPGELFRPVAGSSLRFKNDADTANVARDRDGNMHGGMGIDWGDYDNDGRFDLFVATFHNETKSLYRNTGDSLFSDMGIASGVGTPTAPFVAFGAKFLDFDNDGWLDLVIANGHVQDNIQQIDSSQTYRQATQLFHNQGGKPPHFEEVSQTSGEALKRQIVGRGLAVGDFDNDGRLDILIVDSEGKPLLLHNEHKAAGHWLGVKLEGTKSNRDGLGAILTATVGGEKRIRQCQTSGSYLSASDRRVHFGLGKADKVETLTVRWPSGRTDTYRDLPSDRYITLREGDPAVH